MTNTSGKQKKSAINPNYQTQAKVLFSRGARKSCCVRHVCTIPIPHISVAFLNHISFLEIHSECLLNRAVHSGKGEGGGGGGGQGGKLSPPGKLIFFLTLCLSLLSYFLQLYCFEITENRLID